MTSSRLLTASSVVSAAAFATAGVIPLVRDVHSASTVLDSPVEHVYTGAFTVFLWALVPLVVLLGRRAGAMRPAGAVAAGILVLGALGVSSNVNGEDLAIFPWVAIPANAVWLAGAVLLARATRRAGVLARPQAIALPLIQVCALPLSIVGGGLAAAVIVLVLLAGVRTRHLGASFTLPRAAEMGA